MCTTAEESGQLSMKHELSGFSHRLNGEEKKGEDIPFDFDLQQTYLG